MQQHCGHDGTHNSAAGRRWLKRMLPKLDPSPTEWSL